MGGAFGGLIFIPIGIIWVIFGFIKKIKNRGHKIKPLAIYFMLLPLIAVLSSVFLPHVMKNHSRNFVIKKANEIVKAIDSYKEKNGAYPDSLQQLIPTFFENIPLPGMIGIRAFVYKKDNESYNLEFEQPINFFNYEIVVYDPEGNQKGRGEIPRLHDTSYSNWKYFIFD
jgi:hypothetical protein